jgi:prepilin-type N-terminal cleavage/methylation domain-containing protein
MRHKTSHGFTLVELLVVIAIIGILVALLLPAIQAAREAARRSQCQNHLKQIATGMLLHESAHGHLPVGGWSPRRSGDPDLGAGEDQPGGWPYNLLPYIEEEALHQMGAGVTTKAQKQAQFMIRDGQPVGIYYCPTRGPAKALPNNQTNANHNSHIPVSARTHYAMCVGNAQGDYDTNLGSVPNTPPRKLWNTGVLWPTTDPRAIGARGADYPVPPYTSTLVEMSDITDGTSKTYLVGEAYLNPDYYDGVGPNNTYCANYDWTAYNGSQDDKERSVAYDRVRYPVGHPPTQDTPGVGCSGPIRYAFGSAHSGIFYMAYCDGSVQGESYDIDLEAYCSAGTRNDGGHCTVEAGGPTR